MSVKTGSEESSGAMCALSTSLCTCRSSLFSLDDPSQKPLRLFPRKTDFRAILPFCPCKRVSPKIPHSGSLSSAKRDGESYLKSLSL